MKGIRDVAQDYFVADGPGTDEATWLLDPSWDQVSELDLSALAATYRKVVVAVAHPDDETLGMGATIAQLAESGCEVTVVIATDGQGSHPDSQLWTPERIAAIRIRESQLAISTLAPQARIVRLGLPDGQLTGYHHDIEAGLQSLINAQTLVLTHATNDGHPDHNTVGTIATQLAQHCTTLVLQFPIWMWHWSTPARWDWQATHHISPAASSLQRKQDAIGCYRSQIAPMSPDEEKVMLSQHIVARFQRVTETAFIPRPTNHDESSPVTREISQQWQQFLYHDAATTQTQQQRFNQMYTEADDPWQVNSSWYEQRKRDLTLAMLTQRRYRHIVDIGCGTGVLTAALAQRADHVTAGDISQAAIETAKKQHRQLNNVAWRVADSPVAVPESSEADVVVISEVGYYLRGSQLLQLFRQLHQVVAHSGEVLLCHWRHVESDSPLHSHQVHDQACLLFGEPQAHYHDSDVIVELWSPHESVAMTAGLR